MPALRMPLAHRPWIVVGAVWIVLAVSSGLYFSFPVFFVALLEEFGWSRGATAAAFSISSVVQGVLSPAVGTLVDRLGPRRVMLAGSAVLGLSCVASSLVMSLWSLYLIVGVLAAAGACAVSWVPTGALIAQWFADRRGSAMGVAFSGMGAGVLAVGPLAQWLIATLGWRAAYLVLGAGTLAILLPMVALGVRDAPVAPPPARGATPPVVRWRAAVGDAFRTRAFWALFFAYLFTPLAVFPVVTHQVAFAVDHGFPRLLVATVFGLTGLVSVAGRIGFGIAADRIGRAASATVSYACTAAGTLCLLALEAWPHVAALYGYALLFGLGFGARGPIITAMAAQLFPGRFGAIYGFLSVGNGIGGALGPWFGGVVHDVTGSYRIAFLVAVGFCAAGTACFWLARPPRSR
ncbi:MAG TPA: MFS transporter [Candidatus Tectomicrobia bacterium]|nr:MFS transporter [Candidatus Tectomicrobia bacterium]